MDTICFAASNPTFIDPIAQELSSKYKIRLFYGQDIRNQEILLSFLEHIRDCDVAFVDWCDPYIIQVSQGLKTAKLICRLHSYEFFQGYPSQVNWNNVDKLIYVNHSLEQMMRYSCPISPKKTKVIYHGIDLNKFKFDPEQKQTNTVGVAGFVNYKKDPSYIMSCFDIINRACPDMKFVWAGQHQDPRYHLNFIHDIPRLNLNFEMQPWQEDMNKWFSSVDYILSGSLFESCHLSILEGMACGKFPLVRFWYGADNIYPTHALFASPDQCAQKVLFYQKTPQRIEFAHRHRQWVEKYFNFDRQLQQIDDVIQEVLHG